MLLSELIQPDLIKLNMEARNKWDAIEELIDHLISAHELRMTNRQEVVDAVFAREHSLSTGLEHSLAVPHGAVDCVNDILAGIARLARNQHLRERILSAQSEDEVMDVIFELEASEEAEESSM